MKTTVLASLTVFMLASSMVCAQSVNEILVPGRNATARTDTVVIYSSANGAWVNSENTTHLGLTVNTVGVGDVDNDGSNDILVGGVCPSTGCVGGLVNFLSRDGQGEWVPFYTDTGLSVPNAAIHGIYAADLDGDGINEVLVCGRNTGPNILVYDYQPGTGTFQRNTLMSGSGTNDCAVADMDGDGYPEIFFQNSTSGPILVYEYSGSSYVKVHTIQMSEWIWKKKQSELTVVDDMSFGDVNNDGVPEVLFCGNDAYAVLINYTGGDYKRIFVTNYLLGGSTTDYIQSCDIADLNGDGYNDIILANKQIMYFEKTNKNDRGYAFTSTWNDTKQTYLYSMNAMCSGDADADSRGELFIRSNTADYAFWAFQNDQSPYGPPFDKTVVSTNQASIHCTVADIDSGGLLPQSVCGNGVKEAPETCDGPALGGLSCQSLGFVSGNLTCTAECALDTSQCVANPCGDGYCNGAVGENCNTCPADCIGGTLGGTCSACSGGVCNGACIGKEGSGCADCNPPVSYCCGDGMCRGGESTLNCAYDCRV